MTREATEIEVEVVEIDGVNTQMARTPESGPVPARGVWTGGMLPRAKWPRWWPLWVLAGALALGFALTFGLFIALIVGAVLLVLRLVRALLR